MPDLIAKLEKLTKAQVRFLELLAQEPSIFAWMSKRNGKLVAAFGQPENWTHFQIIKRTKDAHGYVVGRRVATVTAPEHFEMGAAGLTDACAITDAGRALLKAKEAHDG